MRDVAVSDIVMCGTGGERRSDAAPASVPVEPGGAACPATERAGAAPPLRPHDMSDVEADLMASMSEAIAELKALSRGFADEPSVQRTSPPSAAAARHSQAVRQAAVFEDEPSGVEPSPFAASEAAWDDDRRAQTKLNAALTIAPPTVSPNTVEIVVAEMQEEGKANEASPAARRPARPERAHETGARAEPALQRPTEPKLAGPAPSGQPSMRTVPVLDASPLSGEALAPMVVAAPMAGAAPVEAKANPAASLSPILEGKAGGSPIVVRGEGGQTETGGAGKKSGTPLHQKSGAPNFRNALATAVAETRRNLLIVFGFTIAINLFVLAIPVYLFQISDRVLTSRSLDTLAMLTLITGGAIVAQVLLDILRRRILMRTAASIEVRLGAPILSAAARSALGGSGRDYQILGDLAHLRSFITGGTLLAMLDAPLAPIFLLAVWFVHPDLGIIVAVSIGLLLLIATLNKRATAVPFAEANAYTSMANLNLDALSRNSQIINALGMIPEAVRMWGRENAKSLGAQALAQDRNVLFSGLSKAVRLGTQVTLLGWGAMLALEGHLTGGMVISSSIIASRALAPVEGTIEGWRTYVQSKSAFGRIANLLRNSPLNIERLRLPTPLGRLDVDRILFVPAQTKKVILNGLSFRLAPGESMAIIGSSGAGKSTLGKMLVGSIVPTAGNIRLDLMDLKNWDARQLGESIGYLPQDIQLFPASIKANIARMREDATDEMIFEAAALADVHELIASFPQGYETIIGSDGSPLSGGQKQRIGLARAFFGNPKLVVLDEPNSNLDTAGEQALASALLAAKKKGTTVVAITQRTALLRCVDKIMIMKDGTVQAIGERQKILKALAEQKKAGTAPKDLLLAE